MNPLTRTFVRKHRLEADVFRQAAAIYAGQFSAPDQVAGGCCHALRSAVLRNEHRRPYRIFFFELLNDDATNGLLYLWPCPPLPDDVRKRDARTQLTPRLIALELCALMVEDLKGPARKRFL